MRMQKQFNAIFISILVLAGCSGHPGTNTVNSTVAGEIKWKVLGPGGGGGVMKPTLSPFDENLVLTHCDMTGMYITSNGGETWKMKNLWNVPDDFEFDPSDSGTIYVATRGFLHSEDRGSGVSLLLRSPDRGEHWRIIYPDVSRSAKVERLQSTSLLPSQLIPGALDGTIQKVKVDPADNNHIYLGMTPLIDYMGREKSSGEQKKASLVLSEDRGTSWRVLSSLPGKSVLAIFPENKDRTVTVLTESACVRINELNGEVKNLPLPSSSINVADGGRTKDGWVIYIQSELKIVNKKIRGGIYVSLDMGTSWTQINNGLMKGTAVGMVPWLRSGFAVCGSKPEVAYLSAVNPVTNKTGQTEYIYCIYKTMNTGQSWEPVLLSSTPGGYLTGNFSGSWMEKSFDPGWGGNPIDLGVAPGNPDVCYAGDNGRGYKTVDGGKNWVQVYSHNNQDGSFTSSGLDVTTCYGIHFDPYDKNHFFICYTDIGLFHTFNGGQSWYHSISGIPREWQNTCYQVAFDPDTRGKVWSVWANAHDLPRTKMFGGDGFSQFGGGVAYSVDSGLSWKKDNTGIPENSICTNILIDTHSPVDSRTIYVSIFDRGIYKSSDGGIHWSETNTGLGDNLFAWQLRQNSDGRLFALFARGQKNGKTIDGALYYSDNGAGTWQQLDLPEGVNGPHDLLVDPVHPETMYVSCWPRTLNGKDLAGGMIRTDNGGRTWKQLFDDRVRVNSAGMDPSDPEVIYINTFQNAAYRSEDSGNTWKRIEGYRFKWGQRAVPDVNNPGKIFLTTYGGSVFYGPAKGIPGIFEDIENMPEGWW